MIPIWVFVSVFPVLFLLIMVFNTIYIRTSLGDKLHSKYPNQWLSKEEARKGLHFAGKG